MTDDRDNTGRRRRGHMDDDDRALIGHTARTAALELANMNPLAEAVPAPARDEVTDVHKAIGRVLEHEEFTPSQVRLVTAVMEAAWKHQESAERRRMNGDLAVAEVRGGGADTGARVAKLETWRLEMEGVEGNERDDGRIGKLESSQRFWRRIAAAALSLALASAGAAFAALRDGWYQAGVEDTEAASQRAQVDSLTSNQNRIIAALWTAGVFVPGVPPPLPSFPGEPP